MRLVGFGGLLWSLAAVSAASSTPVSAAGHTAVSLRITSPLGRTGLAGPIRIVAQVQQPEVRIVPPITPESEWSEQRERSDELDRPVRQSDARDAVEKLHHGEPALLRIGALDAAPGLVLRSERRG